MQELVIRFLVGLLGAFLLIPLARLAAFRLGIVAAPRPDRWHTAPTPLLGGVAIAAIVLLAGISVRPFSSIALILSCGAIIAVVGLVDDVITLKSSTKLIIEIVLAAVFVHFGYRLHVTTSLTLDTLAMLIWIVGITNALNLLDNMDGLCAGVALIAGTALLVALLGTGQVPPQAQILAVLMGALVAFLLFNVHPASIFLGDSGSLFIGLTLSVIAIGSTGIEPNRSDMLSIVAAPVLVLLVPIFDTTLVTISRLLSGRRPSQGGRDHSSHRLVALGLSEKRAVTVLWALSLVAAVIGVTVRRLNADWAGLVAGLFVLAMVIFAVYLAGVRVYQGEDVPPPRGSTLMIVDFMYKRRFAEVLLDFCLVSVAYYSAYRLRFEGPAFVQAFPGFLRSLPIIIAVQLPALYLFGAYRTTWRYFGLMDAVNLAKGVLLGTFVVWILMRNVLEMPGVYFPATLIVYATLFMLLVTGSRASFRLMGEYIARRADGPRMVVYTTPANRPQVLAFLGSLSAPTRLVGFVYDEAETSRIVVQGYPVLGGYPDLLSLVSAGVVDEVVVCVPEIDPDRLTELRQRCETCRVRLSQLRYDLELLFEEQLTRAGA